MVKNKGQYIENSHIHSIVVIVVVVVVVVVVVAAAAVVVAKIARDSIADRNGTQIIAVPLYHLAGS
jgi:Na+-transporting NADH:ubiquinone oxidoreductase subunit NqrC